MGQCVDWGYNNISTYNTFPFPIPLYYENNSQSSLSFFIPKKKKEEEATGVMEKWRRKNEGHYHVHLDFLCGVWIWVWYGVCTTVNSQVIHKNFKILRTDILTYVYHYKKQRKCFMLSCSTKQKQQL